MAEALLQTKLYIPPLRPNLVPRPHLIEQLNQGLQLGHKLSLISAPAGFGKTTLVREWIGTLRLEAAKESQIEDRVAWLSLDEGDNDPERFLAYLAAALGKIDGTGTMIGKGALSMLQSSQPSPNEPVLISLINDISALPHCVLLVLDDYQLIDSPPVDEALTFFLEHLPPQLRLAVVTRSDPNLPLARHRARGQLTELRATDLRFTFSEAAEFLNQVMSLKLSARDVAALESRTEGWIAGLQLAAISMRGGQDAAGFIKSFTGSHHFVLDYLIEEVFEQQSEGLQTFLLKTAILKQLSGSLCDALTGQDDGRETLEMLDRANLFVVPLDEERQWYRYHHLFADLLRQRQRQTHPDWTRELHRQASDWYEQNSFGDEAIEHALQSEDFEQAADMIEKHVDHVLHFGERTKLQRWLDAIPVEVTFSEPHLCILYAGSLFISGQVDEAERYLQAAEKSLDPGTSLASDPAQMETCQRLAPDNMKLRGRAATMRSFLVSYQGDVEKSVQYAHQALQYLPQSDSTWRCSTLDSLGTAYSFLGDAASAYGARLETVETSKVTGNAYMMLFASLRLVVTLRDLGRLERAIEICQQELKLANESGLSQTSLVGWLYTLWGEMLAERNELDRALQLVNKGVGLTERGNDVALLGSSYLCLLRVLFSMGELTDAEEIIEEVNNRPRKQDLSPWITNQMAAWQARIWLAQEKLDRAYHWVEEYQLSVDEELTPLHDFDYVVLARILVAQGRADEASRLLQRLFDAAEAGGRTSKMIEVRTLQALAFQARGEPDRALAELEQAFALAEQEGFVRVFVDEGRPMARLLHEALKRRIYPEYSRRLLAVLEPDEPKQAGSRTAQADRSELVEPLSERELEVVLCIAQGLTNREIADRLYLSLNTVKVHTRNIYGKLGVHNRTQAVAQARDLGVLPRP